MATSDVNGSSAVPDLDDNFCKNMLEELYKKADDLKTNQVKSSQLVASVSQITNNGSGSDADEKLETLKEMLDKSDHDVLVTKARFVQVGLDWIASIQQSEERGGGGAKGTGSSFCQPPSNDSTNVNVNSFSLFDSFNATFGSLNGTGIGGGNGDSLVNNEFMLAENEQAKQLEHVKAKKSALERELFSAEETVVLLETEKKQLQAQSTEMKLKLETYERRVSGQFLNMRKAEEDLAKHQAEKKELLKEKEELKAQLETATEAIRNFTLSARDLDDDGSGEGVDDDTDSGHGEAAGEEVKKLHRELAAAKAEIFDLRKNKEDLRQELDQQQRTQDSVSVGKSVGNLASSLIKSAENDSVKKLMTSSSPILSSLTSNNLQQHLHQRIQWDGEILGNGSGLLLGADELDESCDGIVHRDLTNAMLDRHPNMVYRPTPSAHSTPFVQKTVRMTGVDAAGREDSNIGEEMKALGERLPLCERSTNAGADQEVKKTMTSSEEKAIQTDDVTNTTEATQTEEEEDGKSPAVLSAFRSMIPQWLTDSAELAKSLVLLGAALIFFTFFCAVEIEGRTFKPVLWQWWAQPLGLPEPTVIFGYRKSTPFF